MHCSALSRLIYQALEFPSFILHQKLSPTAADVESLPQKRSLDHQTGTAMQAVLTTNVIGVTNFFVSQMTGATIRIILCVTVVYLAADKFRDVTEGCRGAFILFAGRAGAIFMISASAMTANIFPSNLKIS